MDNQPEPHLSIEPYETLEGFVADILNESELAINIGANDGVQKGMIFAVYEGEEKQIIDPFTRENLGSVPLLEKIRVQIFYVAEKFALGRTYQTRTVYRRGFANSLSAAFLDMGGAEEKPYTFRRGENDYKEPKSISPENSIIKIKDKVIEIPDPPLSSDS